MGAPYSAFIATAYENKQEAEDLSIILFHDAHITSTSTWHMYNPPTEITSFVLARAAEQDIRDIKVCDEFLLLWHPKLRGALVELGLAIEYQKYITLLDFPEEMFDPSRACAYYHHPYVKHKTTCDYLDGKMTWKGGDNGCQTQR